MNISSLSSSEDIYLSFSEHRNAVAEAAENTAKNASAQTLTASRAADSAELRDLSPFDGARLLRDEEVSSVLARTMAQIASEPYSALGVHRGLDASRVSFLLADVD